MCIAGILFSTAKACIDWYTDYFVRAQNRLIRNDEATVWR